MAGSSTRRSKRLRRNASNGVGGFALFHGVVVVSCLGCDFGVLFVGLFRLWSWCPVWDRIAFMSSRLKLNREGFSACAFYGTGDTDEGIQTNMLDNLPSDNLESPPAVLPTTVQPDPEQDDSDSGLGGEDVQLFPELKIRGSPKHLAWPIKRFNACQKNAVRALGLGDMLDFQVEGIPKSMCRWLISNFDPTNICLSLENGLVLPVTEEDVHYTLGLP
nr:beta-D-glucosyl crocetin beta-1,6-glucosyltransferase-like [Ipomoea batatas]